MDKKTEKRLKDQLSANFRELVNETNIMLPVVDFRDMLTKLLNQKMLENQVYMQMPNEEWSVKIMINILINCGVDTKMDEDKKQSLLSAQ